MNIVQQVVLDISAYPDHIDGKPVWERPLNCSLRECRISFDFIKSSWGSSENLSDKHLAHKVTLLMALTSAPTNSAIYDLDIRFMFRTPHEKILTFHKLHKSMNVILRTTDNHSLFFSYYFYLLHLLVLFSYLIIY